MIRTDAQADCCNAASHNQPHILNAVFGQQVSLASAETGTGVLQHAFFQFFRAKKGRWRGSVNADRTARR